MPSTPKDKSKAVLEILGQTELLSLSNDEIEAVAAWHLERSQLAKDNQTLRTMNEWLLKRAETRDMDDQITVENIAKHSRICDTALCILGIIAIALIGYLLAQNHHAIH